MILRSARLRAMRVAITVDVEQDCPPYLDTWNGVDRGAPRVLELLAEEDVPATFFTTGEAARRHPERVRQIVAGGHELGCHGDSHRRFGNMNETEARREIEDASRELRQFYPVISFRAPNLDFPPRYLDLLRENGYRVDSSQGRHKQGSLLKRPSRERGMSRVPATIAPSAIRLPSLIRNSLLRMMRDPVVLFFHPWEFIDVTREPLPIDCKYRTGGPALDSLRASIRFFRRRGATFHRISELA
jgi:peptidoglycan-N-acetylglucosamine deacetylase